VDVTDRRILRELPPGEWTRGQELRLGGARPFHRSIQELPAHSLTAKTGGDFGMVDDDECGVGTTVGHLGNALSVLLDEEGTTVTALLVRDLVLHRLFATEVG
jgi:hypothetical protein